MTTQQPRTAIVLSAGYFGFFAHAGFMQAVEDCAIDCTAIAGMIESKSRDTATLSTRRIAGKQRVCEVKVGKKEEGRKTFQV